MSHPVLSFVQVHWFRVPKVRRRLWIDHVSLDPILRLSSDAYVILFVML
jgi:hypothetical protein